MYELGAKKVFKSVTMASFKGARKISNYSNQFLTAKMYPLEKTMD